jgi:acyl-CoA hydrolase
MEHYKMVLPEYLNDQGTLFGGYLLKWLDEFAYVTVNIEFPGHHFVTIGLDDVTFRHPIACGQILRFVVDCTRLGNTSVDYAVDVFAEAPANTLDGPVFATRITFVNIDAEGNKIPIPTG